MQSLLAVYNPLLNFGLFRWRLCKLDDWRYSTGFGRLALRLARRLATTSRYDRKQHHERCGGGDCRAQPLAQADEHFERHRSLIGAGKELRNDDLIEGRDEGESCS